MQDIPSIVKVNNIRIFLPSLKILGYLAHVL